MRPRTRCSRSGPTSWPWTSRRPGPAGRLAPAGHAEVTELCSTEGRPVGLYLASFGAAREGWRRAAARAVVGNGHHGDRPCPACRPVVAPVGADHGFLTRTAVLEQLSGPCATRSSRSAGPTGLEAWPTRTFRWSRWTATTGTATTSCSGSCSWTSWSAASPTWSLSSTWRAVLVRGPRQPELVVDHPQAGRDWVARRGRAGLPACAGGRVETARRWFRGSRTRGGLVERYPRVAVLGAQMEALLSDPPAPSAGRPRPSAGRTRRPDPTLDAPTALLRTFLCHDGMAEMKADAATAWDGWPRTDPGGRPPCSWRGSATCSTARPSWPTRPWAGGRVSPGRRATPVASAALGERALVAMERRSWEEAGCLARRPQVDSAGPATWRTTPWPPSVRTAAARRR